MDKPSIGLSQRFQPAAGAAASTVLSGTTSATGKGKGVFATLDWKVKMVVLLIVAALLYFTVVRYLKNKKGKSCKDEAKGAEDKADKKGEKS